MNGIKKKTVLMKWDNLIKNTKRTVPICHPIFRVLEGADREPQKAKEVKCMNAEIIMNIAEETVDFAFETGVNCPGFFEELRDIGIGIATGAEQYANMLKDSEADYYESKNIHLIDMIEKVKFSNSATIVFWKDGTKTVTKCSKNDTFNKETGLAICIIRKLCNNRHYNDVFEKFCK